MTEASRKQSSKFTKPRWAWANWEWPDLAGAYKRFAALACAGLLALAPTGVLAQNSNVGPPRDAAIAGDIAAAELSERELSNLKVFTRVYTAARWFHPSDAALTTDWDALAIEVIPRVIAADSSAALASVLDEAFAPVVEDFEIAAEPLGPVAPDEQGAGPSTERWRWVHTGFAGTVRSAYSGYSSYRAALTTLGPGPIFAEEFAGGIHVRFPLTARKLSDDQLQAEAQTRFEGKPEGWVPAGFDRTTRIAATIIAWGVLDQFYPYWDVVDVDWDAKLPAQLQRAASAHDDDEFHAVLRLMMHEIEDGHGGVAYRFRGEGDGIAPVSLEYIEGQIVAGWAAPETGIPAGSVVEVIDAEPAGETLTRIKNSRPSGSDQWRTRRALDIMTEGPTGSVAVFDILDPQGERRQVEALRVPYTRENIPARPRPDPIGEIADGIFYVDLSRTNDQALIEAADQLSQARGLIFDLRGRPQGRPFFLPHLSDDTVRSAYFHNPIFERLDQANVYYNDVSWRYPPLLPRLTTNTVFLSDERAVSYPESVLGAVKGNALGTIIGRPSAGANGNIARIDVPGGYRLIFTGMRVTNRDGSVHHNIGVLPDVPVELTLEGLRDGRDEILEAGIAHVQEGLDQP